MGKPLLTIAIPTFNRAQFLKVALDQLCQELTRVEPGMIEVLICDNASTDETSLVITRAAVQNHAIRAVRNIQNIGSDANIAQCFDLAMGHYVLVMGDDDILVDGAVEWILNRAQHKDYGVIGLRSYGFDFDFRAEHPGGSGRTTTYRTPGGLLVAIGPLITLISSCVINKRLIATIKAAEFCGSNLVQVHLVIRAALAGERSLYTSHYLVACKRNNSGGYAFFDVFVENLISILNQYIGERLPRAAIRSFETRMLLGFYPFYAMRARRDKSTLPYVMRSRLSARFGRRWLYRLWVDPITWLPRPMAIAWGALVTTIGRSITGDLRRGLAFAWNRVRRATPRPPRQEISLFRD